MSGCGTVDLGGAGFLRAADDSDAVARFAAGLATAGVGRHTRIIGGPSAWGSPRRDRLNRALRLVGSPARLVPRALLIAGSHADAATRSCVVVEPLPVPGPPGDDPGGLWTAQWVARSADGWRIERCTAGWPGDLDELAAFVSGADTVFAEPGTPDLAAALAPDAAIPVDRALIAAHGHRFAPRGALTFDFAPPPITEKRRGAAVAIALAATVVVLLGAAGAVARWPRPGPVAARPGVERIGPVSIQIPAGWRRTALTGQRPDDGRGLRAVFADGGDGRRLIVVVTGLREGATVDSVAASLRNRIAQRGDDVVVEFAETSTYGGRRVISYREAPASGAAIRWYVVVGPELTTTAAPLQVSVGCQPGTGDAPIDPPCRAAVASVRS
ncbi:type VII secretion-associated protein [Gordonia sp. (in: high G+C Gram-positive bacteria)]|uniref:type VII secretion-associated protein n=1 Tax=unclassified Gordonia (in: high G+C Gram-positive bacteria) TaxID=2657482 RepID=UPI002631ACD0|nr:type VII secretion-associated protein [Gordonia sp. (in: high G+C Gram-positive bacteria)]